MDENINWAWSDAFWIYWTFFSLMAGIFIGFMIIYLSKLYSKFFESDHQDDDEEENE
jgi:uncharacterized membrane-anchored protein YhcB (DUF1043 family)